MDFNPFSAEFRADPYPFYKELLASGPMHRSDALGGVIVLTRHADVDFVLHDPRFSADPRTAADYAPIDPNFPRTMLGSDPPDHTRLRTLVNKAFAARSVQSMRPRIQEITDSLLDTVADRGCMDVVADLAYPLPITVIAEVLGVRPEDQDSFREWSYPLAQSLDPMASAETQQNAIASRNKLIDYFRGVVAERRRSPQEDTISALIEAEDEGEQLTEEELLAMLVLLLVAGHETTVNLTGNGLNALLHHPDELAQLRENPSLIRTAIEELLRFDGPVQLTGRHPLTDIEIHGELVGAGATVMTSIGAASRDESVFEDPDAIRLDRAPNPHLAFGQGIHFCVGAPLARLEGQIAIATTLARFPNLELVGEPEFRETLVIRGLKSLNVSW